MSYFEDDDSTQIAELKSKIEDLQAQLLNIPFTVGLENVESGQSILPGANPSARTGGNATVAAAIDPLILQETDLGTIGPSSVVIDLGIIGGNFHRFVIDQPSTSVGVVGSPISGNIQRFVLQIVQDPTGGRAVSWGGAFINPPTIDTAPDAVTTIEFYTYDAGASIYTVGDASKWSLFSAINDIDFSSYDATNIDRLRFLEDSAAPASADDPSIFLANVGSMVFNTADQKQFHWKMGNDFRMQLDQSGVNNDTTLTLQTGNAFASAIPEFELFRDDPTPADDTEIAGISFIGSDAASSGGAKIGSQVYSRIVSEYENVVAGREASSLNFFASYDTGAATQLKAFVGINNENSNAIDAFEKIDLNLNDIINVNTIVGRDDGSLFGIVFDGGDDSDTFFTNNASDDDRIDVFNNGFNTWAFTYQVTDAVSNAGFPSGSEAYRLSLNDGVVSFHERTAPADGIIGNSFGHVYFDDSTDPPVLKIKKKSSVGAISTVSLEGAGGGVAFPIEPTLTDNSDTWTGTQTLDLDTGDGHVYKWTVDQDLTFAAAVSNKPPNLTQRTFELEFEHDEVGGTFTVTLPSNFSDEFGNTVASFDISSGTVIITCRINDGTNFIVLQKNIATSTSGFSGNLSDLVIDSDLHMSKTYKVTFDDDQDTYIRANPSTDDVLEFFTNNLERMQIGPDNNMFLASGLRLHMASSNEIVWDFDEDSYFDSPSDDRIDATIGSVLQLSLRSGVTHSFVDFDFEGNDLLWGQSGFAHSLTPAATSMTLNLGDVNDSFRVENSTSSMIWGVSTSSVDYTLSGHPAISNMLGLALGGAQDADEVTRCSYWGSDDGSVNTEYARVSVFSSDITDGTEDGTYEIHVMDSGTLTKALELDAQTGEVLVWLGDLDLRTNNIENFTKLQPTTTTTYTPTNVTTTRSFDADSTTLAEIADVLGTLIADFQALETLN